MLNYDEDLTELVESLICTGREDDWWDFKECYHEDRAALLHDIISFSSIFWTRFWTSRMLLI